MSPTTSPLRPRLQPSGALLLAACLTGHLAGCAGDPPQPGPDDGVTDPSTDNSIDPDPGTDPDGEPDKWQEALDQRQVDYSAALRIAALRLTGELPTLAEIKFVADASNKREAYEALISSYLDDKRFARQMFSFFEDTFKMGDAPVLDSAPAFAAQVAVEDRPYSDLFTAQSGTCPTFDPETGTFTPADCDNGVPTHAGVLTNPGVMTHFYSNMAFRRVRWVQETFACTAFPAEVGEVTEVAGGAAYTAPWPFESIAGTATGGDIDFRDTSSVVCANCHATMNHLAPLFAHFDQDGNYSADIAVTKPTAGLPLAQLKDWLPGGQTTAWRFGVPAESLPALGADMAADPKVAECAVARTWNWAMGKGDIVDTLAIVPSEVIQAQTDEFMSGGQLLKPLIFSVFTSDDFVRF